MLRERSKHCNRSVPHKLKHVRRSDQLQKKLSPNTNMSRFSLNAQQLSSDSSVSWKLGPELRSKMSGFTVRLATMVCVLVFLYNRQSSAHVWHPKKATVTNLPVNPNDPFYKSKSFFFSWPCVVTFIRASFSWHLVPNSSPTRPQGLPRPRSVVS